MINIIKGNIFTTKCQTIVNTVNCVGVMGAGIAYECRLRYPHMYEIYQQHCKNKKLEIGKLWLYRPKDENEKWILNFPTKNHWKYESKIEYIEKGLQKFLDTYKEKGITSIAFPLLGASNGGIHEDVALEVMKEYLNKCNDIDIEIYQFDPYASDDLYSEFKKFWSETPDNELKNAYKIFKDKKNNELKLKLKELKENSEEMNIAEIEIIEKKLNEKTIPVSNIKKALEDSSVKSLNGLSRAKGIGSKTLEKAFHFANYYKKSKINKLL